MQRIIARNHGREAVTPSDWFFSYESLKSAEQAFADFEAEWLEAAE